MALHVRPATRADVPVIFRFICELAEYERARDQVKTDAEALEAQLFGATPGAEVVIGEIDGTPRGFALFFHSFSTWEGKRAEKARTEIELYDPGFHGYEARCKQCGPFARVERCMLCDADGPLRARA